MDQHLLEIFFSLIGIDSETGNEKMISDHCLALIKKLGFPVSQNDLGNLFISVSSGKESAPIMLNAHLDTIAPGKGITPAVKDDIIYSSGETILGADNKVMLAVILRILKDIHAGSLKLSQDLEIALTISEESDNVGAKNLPYDRIRSRYVVIADSLAPIGTIITGAPFYHRFDGRILGKSAHASTPEKGQNVLFPFLEFLSLAHIGNDQKRCLNIGLLEAGTARNTVPGIMEFRGEIRGFDNKTMEKEIENLHDLTERIKSQFGLESFSLQFTWENDGYRIDLDDPMVKKVVTIMKNMDIPVTQRVSWGCSDANIFTEHGLIPINIGDGVENAHTTKEAIRAQDIRSLYAIISRLIST